MAPKSHDHPAWIRFKQRSSRLSTVIIDCMITCNLRSYTKHTGQSVHVAHFRKVMSMGHLNDVQKTHPAKHLNGCCCGSDAHQAKWRAHTDACELKYRKMLIIYRIKYRKNIGKCWLGCTTRQSLCNNRQQSSWQKVRIIQHFCITWCLALQVEKNLWPGKWNHVKCVHAHWKSVDMSRAAVSADITRAFVLILKFQQQELHDDTCFDADDLDLSFAMHLSKEVFVLHDRTKQTKKSRIIVHQKYHNWRP